MSHASLTPALLAMALGTALPAWAQSHAGHAAMDHAAMDHAAMGHTTIGHDTPAEEAPAPDHAGMDHATMDHSSMDHSSMDHSSMDHSSMDHAAMGHAAPTAPREPIPVPTAADRAAAFPSIDHGARQHAPSINHFLLVDRLEHWDGGQASGQAWEVNGWLGSDLDRLWLRSEGERSSGRTDSADVELLYGRSVSPWWDLLVGVRQDLQPDGRSWAAFGIQGLAPYKFETSATLYLGSGGQLMAKGEVEYELLLSNRLILQPRVEATAAARSEPRHGIGSGLNKVDAGLRLRYEFSRRFAPYIGISHERLFGDTADLADHRTRDTRWVAGVRLWF